MADRWRMKLGHIPSGPSPSSTLTLGKLGAVKPLPSPPDVVDWTNGIDGWPLLRNDVLGDCTVCGVLHAIQTFIRWRDGTAPQPVDGDAEAGYRALGWDGAGEGDGARLVDVVTHWRDAGFPWRGTADKIYTFVRVEPAHVKQALWLFGPLLIGALLPNTAATEDVFTTPADLTGDRAPGSLGGHCMLLPKLDADDNGVFVTWGEVVPFEAGWMRAYVDEIWAVIHPVWSAADISPAGFSAAELGAALAHV